MDFAQLQDVLNVELQEPLADLINRSNPVLSAINKKAVSSQQIYLKGRLDSDHAAGPITDGADVTFAGTETTTYINPTLDWSTYISKFSIPKRLIDQVASNPGQVGNILQEEIEQATKDLADKIAADLFAGDVASGLVGMQSIIDDSNTYAGVDRSLAANANFRSVVVSNVDGGGTAQELSTTVLNELDRLFFEANGYGFVEMPGRFTGVSGAALQNKYRAMMESIDLSALASAHFINQANSSGYLGIGQVGFMGIPFLRDRNVSTAAGDEADTGRLYILDMSQIDLCVLSSSPDGQIHQIQGYQSAPDVDGIPAKIEILGSSGESVNGYVKAYVQLATKNPKAAGCLLKNTLVV